VYWNIDKCSEPGHPFCPTKLGLCRLNVSFRQGLSWISPASIHYFRFSPTSKSCSWDYHFWYTIFNPKFGLVPDFTKSFRHKIHWTKATSRFQIYSFASWLLHISIYICSIIFGMCCPGKLRHYPDTFLKNPYEILALFIPNLPALCCVFLTGSTSL
jgi:hypothetical protein